MTEIRWKNGGPLFIQPRPGGGPIGLVAADPDCCCSDVDPPPPPRCWDCPDPCSYFIEFLSPESLAVKSPSITCGQVVPAQGGVNIAEFPFSSALPAAISPAVESSFSYALNYGALANSAAGILNASAASLWQGEIEFDCPGQPPILYATVLLNVSVYCNYERTPSPVYAIFGGSVLCQTTALSVAPQCISSWAWYFDGLFDIPVGGCQSSASRNCYGYKDPFRFITTPLTFTIDKNGCSLGGSIESVLFLDNNAVAIRDLVQAAGEAVRDAFSYTLRITSRPSCNTIPADCEVPIEGRVVYFPRDGVAVYGYEFGTPKTDVYDFGVWEFAHDGVANGTAESPYVFNAKKFAENPAGFILEEHNLEVFCALDDTVTPPVSRWYVRESVYCTPEFGRQTTDQWISEIPTYPEPDRETPCEGVSAGDPVPVGITEYERVDGYPIVDFGEPCDPPPPIGLQITDGCS